MSAPRASRTCAHSMLFAVIGPAVCLILAAGCGHGEPPAGVEGTLRLDGKPLDHCLVTFLPEPGVDAESHASTGLTDAQGRYQLCQDNGQAGASAGWHRVIVQDLLVSSGMRRSDHGTVDLEIEESGPPPPVRRSRFSLRYLSPEATPLRLEVKQGQQVIDLELE